MRAVMRAPTDRYDRYDYLAYEYPQAGFIMTKLAQLRGARTLPQLARVLDVKPASLSFILYWTPPDRKYTTFTIPKKGGGRRNITAPWPRLKMIQTKLAGLLLDIQAEMESTRSRSQCRLSHGFKEDFSIVTNAAAHRNRRYVLNTDLKDFFPSINFGRVLGFFAKDRNFELPLNVATIIAQIACHNNELPQGSPCSPVISNLIAHVLDIHLNKVARAGHCTYTRYVDDLTFSTNEKEFPATLARLKAGSKDAWEAGNSLVRYVYRSGFKLNHDKTRMQQRDSRQDATGLIVNKKVNVRNEYYKTARAKCDHLFQNGFCYVSHGGKHDVISDDSLEGEMSFIFHIRGLKTTNWFIEQKSFAELYRKFLDYRAFYGIGRPRIICEGKTDNIYLRSALSALRAKFPDLIDPNPTVGLRVDFFNCTKASAIFQGLSGGSDQLKTLVTKYRQRISPFKYGATQPVIMIIDNDSGSKGLFSYLSSVLGKKVDGTDPFYYAFENLYIVPIPKAGAAIEDLFDPPLLKRLLNGKQFDKTGKEKEKDPTKWYSKVEFATQIVKPERSKIDFTGFEPLLKTISDVQKDFAVRRPPPLVRAA
jgi:RNA-directed DNA polymerase